MKRKPLKITEVIADEKDTVTDTIKPLLGPNEDFNGVSVTPKQLGYESLEFKFINGNSNVFTGDEPIEINHRIDKNKQD